MQNVRGFFIFSLGPLAVLLLLLNTAACMCRGAVTPQQAFASVKEAFEREDAVLLSANLSSAGLSKIDAVRSQFAAMPDAQLNAAAQLYGMTAVKLKAMSREDIIRLIIIHDKKALFSGNSNPEGIEINESNGTANVLMANGSELRFVKEGLYWKLDITDL